ncbi:Co-chaperone [Blastocladiella emersonii ATCC 22665]|nr:Co-chaperone [Blastocladiella emersonii ATCC 22665]
MTQTPPTEDKNWRNAGNWHWVTKDSLPFAKEYLTRELGKIAFDCDGVHVAITDVTELTGDCSLNVRKGKLITIYDIKLHMTWTSRGPGDLAAAGRIAVPEIAHDTDEDDLVFNVTVNDDARAKDPVRAAIRKGLRPHVVKVLRQFPKDLQASQSEGVFIDGAVPSAQLPTADLEERKRLAATMDTDASFANTFSVEQRMGKGKAAAAAATSTSTPAPAAAPAKPAATAAVPASKPASPTPAAKPKTKASTTEYTYATELRCSLSDAHGCFTDAGRLRHWTQGQSTIDPKVGGAWSIFGQVHAEIAALSPTELSLKWRLGAWPAATASSDVTLIFTQLSDATRVALKHSGIPTDQRAAVENHWTTVFNRIKMAFGYGSFL